MRAKGWAVLFAFSLAGCGGSGSSEPERLFSLADAGPGDIVGLLATEEDDTRFVEWLDRTAGTVRRLDIDADEFNMETVASIEVGTMPNDQRGLLGHATIGDRRFVAWTTPDALELDVGELFDDGSVRVIWSAGETGDGAIGGVLQPTSTGQLLLGLGRNTDWDAATDDGGAILALDPDGNVDQDETVISIGYTNPWAFIPLEASDGSSGEFGEIWVADNAAGPHPDDPDRDDIERIGRATTFGDRNDMDEVTWPGRAPTAMVELPDGRIGICGFLDNELRAYEVAPTAEPQRFTLDRAGTVMPCMSGAAVFDDGTIVTVAQTDDGMAFHILRN